MTPLSITIVNCVGIILLSMIVGNKLNVRIKNLFGQKCYYYGAIATILILFVDTISWWTNGLTFTGAMTVNRIVNVVYYLLNPLSGFFWLGYVDYKIFNDQPGLKKRMKFYSIPLIIHSILSILNLFFDIFFEITPENQYARTAFMPISSAISYGYLLIPFVLLLKNRRTMNRRNFIPMILFPVPPVICSILQIFFYGISLIWIGEAISILTIYIYIQNDEAKIDFLTGLLNRKLFEEYLSSDFRNRESNRLIIGIMLDIDKFKTINDTYGHAEGDRALIEFGRILESCVRRGDIVARYAGDEFFILLKDENENIARLTLDKISVAAHRFNSSKVVPYFLAYSYGLCISKKGDGLTPDTFLKHADEEMYAHKLSKTSDNED